MCFSYLQLGGQIAAFQRVCPSSSALHHLPSHARMIYIRMCNIFEYDCQKVIHPKPDYSWMGSAAPVIQHAMSRMNYVLLHIFMAHFDNEAHKTMKLRDFSSVDACLSAFGYL